MVVFRSRAVIILVAAVMLVGFLSASDAHAEKKYHVSQDFQVEPTVGGYWIFHNDVDAFLAYGLTLDYYFNEFWGLEVEALALEFFMNSELDSDQKNFFRTYETIPTSIVSVLAPASAGYTNAQRSLFTEYITSLNSSAMPVPKRDEQISGYNFTIGPRFNFFPTEMGGLFLAVGVGAAFTDQEVPYSGQTSFFSFKTEIGQDLRITDHFSFLIRMGYRHLGGFDSKQLGGVGGSVGLGYTF